MAGQERTSKKLARISGCTSTLSGKGISPEHASKTENVCQSFEHQPDTRLLMYEIYDEVRGLT